ncbi:hypothetical protein BC834DRAFT_182113 [Gloeopeniophorella convolvens]|nr:hypothetical protein BC834DRAFT_182113 [Gloeopeniophorella convolvens]
MGSVCFSPVPILRCDGLSRAEEAIVLAPVGLEVIFSLGLIFAGRHAGKTRFILAAEAPCYLLLAVLDYLGHVVPVFQTSLVAYKSLDIAVGAASFIPILLFTSYLYLFKRKEVFPHFPKRFILVANAFALVVIPVILVTNDIGSFMGITYRMAPEPISHTAGKQLAVGSYITSFQFAREFVTSTSLALMATYEAVTFFVFFLRLASSFWTQRNIEQRAATENEGVLFQGMGWLAIGMKLAAVESVIGFATTSFGVVLTRRILRMLGRACVIIGVVKGPDRKEDFFIYDNERGNAFLSGTRKLDSSGNQLNISSPQFVDSSMTQRLSRMAPIRRPIATFVSPGPVSPTSLAFGRKSPSQMPGGALFDAYEKTRPPPLKLARLSGESHVTVVRGRGRAPTLILNLPQVDLPSGDTLAAMSEKQANTPIPDEAVYRMPLPQSALAGHTRHNSLTSTASFYTQRSLPLQPPPPPHIVSSRGSTFGLLGGSDKKPDSQEAALRRGPSTSTVASGRSSVVRRSRSLSRTPSSRRKPAPSVRASMLIKQPTTRALHAISTTSEALSDANGSVESGQWLGGPARGGAGPMTATDVDAYRHGGAAATRDRAGSDGTVGTVDTVRAMSTDWIAPERDQLPARVKSIGEVLRWPTPAPQTHAGHVRASVVPEHRNSEQDRDQGQDAAGPPGLLPRRDSDVLASDDPARTAGRWVAYAM